MKLLMTKIAILTGCLTLSACVFSDSPGKPGALTKEAAKKITNPGEDLCDVYNWYGDGECDMFCENADPDCAVQCDGIPVCDSSSYQVEVCDSGSRCQEVSLCGATILCQQEEIYCMASGLSQPYQECEEGYEIVEACLPNPAGGDCYEIEGFCGGPTLFCQQSDSQCELYPVCPADMVEVEGCDNAIDIQCFEETRCGTTISCRSVEVCDFELSCGQGYVEIDSCPTDVNCYEESACGQTISCIEAAVNCLAYPVCPPDTKEVQMCAADALCPTVTMCGVTIICQGM